MAANQAALAQQAQEAYATLDARDALAAAMNSTFSAAPAQAPSFAETAYAGAGNVATSISNAFSDAIDLGDFKVAVGAALRLDVVLGFFSPGSFDLGFSRGLSSGGVTEWWLYLSETL
jgi:hypothetical protein